jgi:hypothetical protein
MKMDKLDSGFWYIRGDGPCEWAQPPTWPCDEKTLREHTFSEASEKFIKECLNVVSPDFFNVKKER